MLLCISSSVHIAKYQNTFTCFLIWVEHLLGYMLIHIGHVVFMLIGLLTLCIA